MKLRFCQFIGIVVMCTIIGFLFGVAAASHAEAASYKTIDIGKQPKKGDWVQGVEATPDGLFVMDGTVIKKINGKKITEFFNAQDLSKVLPKELNHPTIVNSFLLTQMHYDNGRLYVSGLVYKNIEDENKKWNNQKVAGETHTVVFSIKERKPHLIHTSLAYYNKAHQHGDYYETETELPDNMFVADYGILVAYGRHVNKPRFTITKDHELIFVAQREGDRMDLYVDVYKYKNNKKELLYTHQVYDEEYVIPVLIENQLTLYYEISNQYDDYNIKTINLKTKKEIGTMVPEDLPLERPLEINGQMYFLNDDGIYKVWNDGKYMNMKWILQASDLTIPIWISGWDYDGKYVYIADYDRRVIHKVTP